MKEPKIDLKSQSLTFSGFSVSLKRAYALTLEFYAEVDEAASKYNHTQKNIQFVLRKKELKEEFWPRLLKDSKKVHFLKTDFDKWVDEDEQDEAPEEDLSQMGGMGKFHIYEFSFVDKKLINDLSGGMPGMGDMMGGAGGDFGGIDFSKLGGADMGGMGGMMGGEDDEADVEDDEEMPALEGEEEAAAEPKAKITEVA